MAWYTDIARRARNVIAPRAPRNDTVAAVAEAVAKMPPGDRRDAWANILTAIGTTRDKRTAGEFRLDPVTDIEAAEMWRGDDIAKRVIEALPKDALRRGYDLKLGKKELSEAISARLESKKANRMF